MSKKQPLTVVQKFAPNEYVAACGDHGVTYKFECNAGGGIPGSVYQETNGIDGLQTHGGRGYSADRESGRLMAAGMRRGGRSAAPLKCAATRPFRSARSSCSVRQRRILLSV